MVLIALFQILGKVITGSPSEVKVVLVEQVVIDGEIGILYNSPTRITIDIRKIGNSSTLYLRSKEGSPSSVKLIKDKQ